MKRLLYLAGIVLLLAGCVTEPFDCPRSHGYHCVSVKQVDSWVKQHGDSHV